MDEFEIILVKDDLQKKGFSQYNIQAGNDCIWVSVNRGNGVWLDFYYIFREGRIADIQVD